MSSPDNQDFHVDISFSAEDTYKRFLISAIVAGAAILFIIATMTTSLSSHLLPMNDEYLAVLVPVGADGQEPLGLKSLEHEIKDNSATIRGTVENRTEFPISGLIAVIDIQDTTSRFGQTLEIPVDPPELQPQQSGSFMGSATLEQKVSGYLVKFRLANGPLLPHKDDRPTLGITVQ
jgi:hypothetical protein